MTPATPEHETPPPRTVRAWTAPELAYLRECIARQSTIIFGVRLERSLAAVRTKAQRLHWRIPRACLPRQHCPRHRGIQQVRMPTASSNGLWVYVVCCGFRVQVDAARWAREEARRQAEHTTARERITHAAQ